MSVKVRMMNEQPKKWSNFKECTKDFKSITSNEFIGEMYISKVKHLSVDYIEPYMIYTIFVELLEVENTFEPMEKVLYEVFFQYRGYQCMFSMEKFGLKFAINSKEETIVEEMFKKIKSAAKIVEKLLQPIITDSIDNGDLTIKNYSGILRQRYLYFRSKTERILAELKEDIHENPENIFGRLNAEVLLEKEIVFNTQAMLDAYFSLQENYLILLLPFTNIDFTENRITSLIDSNWSDKFNKVFMPAENPDLMRHYNDLKKFKELRNKYAHGGFEKNEGSILPHIEGIGAIPVGLPSNNRGDFSFILIEDIKFEEICNRIDAFENYLSNSEWSRAVKILESGTDIRFDKEYILELKTATNSEENLESFLDKESYIYEREANMDW